MSNLLGEFDLGSGSLSRETRIGLINTTLPSMIENGISATSALSIYKEAGLGIRRQDFLNLYRSVLGEEQRSNRIRSVPSGNTPTPAVFDQSKYKLTAEYRIVFKAQIYNTETGKTEDSFFGIDYNTLSTIDDMTNDAMDYVLEQSPDVADRIRTIQVWKGFRTA